jgi:hypothetical protein
MNTSMQEKNHNLRGDEAGKPVARGELDEMARKHKEATIIRAPKDRENPYKAVRRATFEDARLTWEARGILAYLLVKPDTWEININDLWRAGDVGRDKVYRIVAHLEKYGYLERVEVREKGKFMRIQYLLHEEPLPEIQDMVPPTPFPENQEMVPLPEIQETATPAPLPEIQEMATRVEPFPEKPYTVNQERINKEDSSKEETSKKEEELGIVGAAPTPPLASPSWLDFVGELCWVCYGHRDTKALTAEQGGALLAEAKKLREDDYQQEDLHHWFMKIWRNNWRWDKGRERPRPDMVRSSIPQLRAGAGQYSERPDDDRASSFSQYNPYKNGGAA